MADGSRMAGGDKALRYLEDLGRKLGDNPIVRIGFLEGSKHDSAETFGRKPREMSLPMLAIIHEFGAPAKGIPPRPFMRPTVADGSPHWGEELATLLKDNGGDAEAALGTMGERIKDEVVEHINTVSGPPLKPETIKRKGGSATILIDSGNLRNGVRYEVDPTGGAS